MNKGVYFHTYHNQLLSYCSNAVERRKGIRFVKPEYQRAIRLRLFKPYNGVLPRELRNLARKIEAYVFKHNYVSGSLKRDWRLALAKHRVRLEAIHDKLCKNCIWDGRELDFSKV